MEGVLLIDKPAGWTSFDVVNYVRKQVAEAEGKKPRQIKVGHTGTLDPFATGLLVLLVGKAYTKRAQTLSKLDKSYEVTVKLGSISSTGDPEGEITPYRHLDGSGEISRQARDDNAQPTLEEINSVLPQFAGVIQQVPPAYSAIKIDGQRAYKLARAGKEVVIEPRKVTVNRLQTTDYSYPELKLEADVSSGTYIRTLVEDIGQALGTGAYTVELRRTQVGEFSLDRASTVKDPDLLNRLTKY